jgi:hypothetical protein
MGPRDQGDRYMKQFRCLEQYLVIAFAQLSYRGSLRDIKPVFFVLKKKLYPGGGIRATTSWRTLADTNEQRDWRIYPDFAQSLIKSARPLYANEDLGFDFDNTIYALDASTIDL